MKERTQVLMEWNGDKVKALAEKAAMLSAFKMGFLVQGQAKLLAPVGKEHGGRLRASITTSGGDGQSTKPMGKNAVSTDIIKPPSDKFEVFVGTPVFYAPYVEYGTVRASAQPFLRPALDIAKGRKLTLVEETLKDGKVRQAFGEYLQ